MPPDPKPPVTSTAGSPSWMAPVTPGVPDHELVRRIGGGSYGDVWLARNVVGTWRAVKVVFRDRFTDSRPYEREYNGIQKFEPLSRSNEGFVDILQIGRNDAEGYFYYVMELADDAAADTASVPFQVPSFQTEGGGGEGTSGASLKTEHLKLNTSSYVPKTLAKVLLQRSRLPVNECLELGITLNLALGHLHRAGLIHRDIKPSNIIFVGGVPKLADIGLVVETSEARSYVGTEGFIPPEGPTSPQADLYSLGKVLYEAGMGKDRKDFPEPFTQIAEAADRDQVLEFNTILLKACAANVKDRYQTAEEMNAELALLQSGGSVRQQRSLSRRLRFVQRAGALVTVLAAVIALGWWWQARQTRIVRKLATEKERLAESNARLAEENRQRILRRDVASGVKLLDEGDPAGALLWFADALPLVTNNPAEESIHRIRIRQTLNQIPQLLQVLPHTNEVLTSAMSSDGRRIVTGTDWGYLRVWDAQTGAPLWEPLDLEVYAIAQARFTPDGRFVFASSLPAYGFSEEEFPTNIATLIETESGHPIVRLSGTNWLRADLSPDGRWLVTADTDHVIHVHDASNGKAVADFSGHTNRISGFSFSEKGDILASSSDDHTIRLWRLPRGESIAPAIPYDGGPMNLSGNGKWLVTATVTLGAQTNSTIHIWDVSSGASVGSPIEMPGSAEVLWFVSQNEHFLYVGTDQKCALFDSDTHRQVLGAIVHPSDSPFYSVSPDGRRVAFGGPKGLNGVWSLETGELLLPPCLRDRQLTDVNFSPDGSQLLVTSVNGAATLINSYLLREDTSYRFDGPVGKAQPKLFLESRRFSPDRRFFLLIPQDKTVHLVDFRKMTDEDITAPEFRDFQALQCTFDISGHQRAFWYSGKGTNVVELWSEHGATTNRFILPHPTGLMEKFVFTPDGSRLITPANDRKIRFWRTTDGTLEQSVPIAATGQVAPFSDGHTAFGISSATRHFALFDLNSGESRNTQMPPFTLTGFIVNPARDRFASTGFVNWSRVWSMRMGEALTPPLDHGGEVRWVDWSPDGKRLLTAGLTPEVRVWDAATGEQLLAPIRLGTKPLETAQWSLDGRLIVARSDENVVRVWDAATGEPVTPVLRHRGYVRGAFLVADNRLVTISLPNRMRAWDLQPCPLSPDALTDYAKLLSGRRLSAVGAMLKLTPDELYDLNRSLKSSHAGLFAARPGEVQEWHRRLVDEPTTPTRIEAGLFHLNCMAQAAPDDTWTKNQLAWFQSCQIPPRDPEAPANLLDLTPFYTHSLDGLWLKVFARLPRRVQTLAGTAFDVRGIVRLETIGSGANNWGLTTFELLPKPAVNGIPVSRACRALHFLQGVDGGRASDGQEIAKWVIHCADGTRREWPVIYGKQVHDFWLNPGKPEKPTDGVIAWEGHAPVIAKWDIEKVRLFKSTWTNPSPAVEIKSLDFVASTPIVCPFVVAITAE